MSFMKANNNGGKWTLNVCYGDTFDEIVCNKRDTILNIKQKYTDLINSNLNVNNFGMIVRGKLMKNNDLISDYFDDNDRMKPIFIHHLCVGN
mmetsp:Transcript_27563/g.33661  ORF Transcript_27563/g.33661 Transcript_27563/m.33661 type:complete len:92 (+) Transcript_27563:44-319(+)